MSDIAIRVENLSKRYQLGADGSGIHRFSELLYGLGRHAWQLPRRWLSHAQQATANTTAAEHWALRDVSFEVKEGEVVGVIGRNGAGKSTLLKILSRITEPTSGRIGVRGRIGSLLEVGTGFHPELTGRENIFLNGAILGMSRAEVQRRFDEIVAFAEIDQFLDTPVKRYSSGMYVRLGFAVAAHLETEILIVDEVLAVGDAFFQRKCLGKIDDVAKSGRTVLLVSHNIASVERFCHKAVALQYGVVLDVGAPSAMVRRLDESRRTGAASISHAANNKSTKPFSFRIRRCVLIGTETDLTALQIDTFSAINLRVEAESNSPRDVWVGVEVTGRLGETIAVMSNRLSGLSPWRLVGESALHIHIPRFPLLEGLYHLSIRVVDARTLMELDRLDDCQSLVVVATDAYGSGFEIGQRYGLVHFDHQWTYPTLSANADTILVESQGCG